MFGGDTIECVQTLKYLGILLETILNMDSEVDHLTIANRRSLFTLNHRYAKLRIMDVKIHCDLFNTVVHSITNYAYEVWMDCKKIKVNEVMYRRFFKSLFGVRKTTSTSIVLAEFSKFPFEHFAWGQLLLYYNCVSIFINDCILRKAWEAQFVMLVVRKMLGWICEKMAIQESAPGGGRFFASGSIIVGNGTSTCNGLCTIGGGYSTTAGNGL